MDFSLSPNKATFSKRGVISGSFFHLFFLFFLLRGRRLPRDEALRPWAHQGQEGDPHRRGAGHLGRVCGAEGEEEAAHRGWGPDGRGRDGDRLGPGAPAQLQRRGHRGIIGRSWVLVDKEIVIPEHIKGNKAARAQ